MNAIHIDSPMGLKNRRPAMNVYFRDKLRAIAIAWQEYEEASLQHYNRKLVKVEDDSVFQPKKHY
jgi:hypothetical protein